MDHPEVKPVFRTQVMDALKEPRKTREYYMNTQPYLRHAQNRLRKERNRW